MSISHDEYLKYTSHTVNDEVLEFHAKGNYTIHEYTQHLTTLHHIPANQLEKLTGNELTLNPLSNNCQQTSCMSPLHINHPIHRNDSCDELKERTLEFSTVESLLAPLLRKNNTTYKRGYPSGGALYPIEVFCVNLQNRISDWPHESNALHLLSASRTLEVYSPQINIRKLSRSVTPTGSNIGSPSLALIYCIYLPKALFKYRYRGYRLALMEAGSMYMIIDLRCKELRLDSRPWSGFSDHEITKNLNLNPTLFLPAGIQLIG